MGRHIDLSRPLSDEDREYLMSRSREGEVIVNDRQFGGLSDDERTEVQEEFDKNETKDQEERKRFQDAIEDENANSYPWELVDKVEPLTLNQLRSALKKRDLSVEGNKDELRVRLITFLEEQLAAAEAEKAAAVTREAQGA